MSATMIAGTFAPVDESWIDPSDDTWWSRAVEEFNLDAYLAPLPMQVPAQHQLTEPTVAATAATAALNELAGYEDDLERHDRNERQILWKELASVGFVTAVVVVRQFWLS